MRLHRCLVLLFCSTLTVTPAVSLSPHSHALMPHSRALVPHSRGLVQHSRALVQSNRRRGEENDATPTEEARKGDGYQCDRECRWTYGFGDHTIIGELATKSACRCWKCDTEAYTSCTPFAKGTLIARATVKAFDSYSYWGGEYISKWRCVIDGANTKTIEAPEDDEDTLHCGMCGKCSTKHDTAVMVKTRKWTTEVVTKIASKMLMPMSGHSDIATLKTDMAKYGLDFTSNCMDCWADRVLCAYKNCKYSCAVKFFSPKNQGKATDCSMFDTHCKCLECEEKMCSAEFMKCSGASPRALGVQSGIRREKHMMCKDSMYAKKDDLDLDTLPMPVVA